MPLRQTLDSLQTMLTNSGLLDTYQGYVTAPFNFPSTAIIDNNTQTITISEAIGLRSAGITQEYNYDSYSTLKLFLGRAFLVQNNQLQEASIVASELGESLLTAINNWGVNCGVGVDRLSGLSATPQIKQDERIAQALRAIAGSPNTPTTTSTYWYAEVIVSFSMRYTH
jgi:hypothetical protein